MVFPESNILLLVSKKSIILNIPFLILFPNPDFLFPLSYSIPDLLNLLNIFIL
jgi:hypothetical protein